MEKTSFERTSARRRTLRRASLLLGTGLFLNAAPAWAVNECGPVPPGGGTVTCQGQNYPDGIRYFSTGDLEVLTMPGFLTRRSSTLEAVGAVRVDTPPNFFRDVRFVSESPGLIHNDALRIIAGGPIFLRANSFLSLVAGGGGGSFEFVGSADIGVNVTDTFNLASPGIIVSERLPVAPGPLSSVLLRTTFVGTRGNDSPAITISSGGDSIRIDPFFGENSVTTEGDASPGIRTFSNAPSNSTVIISKFVRTRGANSVGVQAGAGNVTLALGSVGTSGANSPAIVANGNSAVSITVATVTTAGINSPGITAVANTGPINVTSGSVTTGASIGIDALTSTGAINIVSGSVVTQGAGSSFRQGAGISAHSNSGKISVASGSVTTTGTQAFGIYATSGGDVKVVANTIATTGALANAIFAVSRAGSISVTSGPLATLRDSATGVVTFLVGAGTTSVRTDSITTQGFDSYGVIATTIGTGAIDIAGEGTIVTTGASSPGISAESGGAVTVSANNISASGANSDAIAVKGSTSNVTIRGVVESSQGFAVRGEGGLRQSSGPGGPVTVNILGGGTLRGRLNLTGGADRIENSGTFDAIGTSQFKTGLDAFNNNAGATVRAVNGGATFAGLESFDNRGTIDLRDGATGDSLTLDGAYSGAGGARLGLDVDFGAGTADRLVTGAATGSTTIEVLGSGGGFTSGILLVDGGAGTSPTAFTLAGGTNSPYLTRDLSFDAANNDFLLVQLPGTAVFETARFGQMATQLWYESADAVAAQLDTQRDGRRGRGPALWLQGWTGERERGGSQTLAGAGTFDVAFEQDFQGLQGGLDFQSGSGVVGITGGAGRSDAVFAATGNPVDMDVKNVGLYAQVRAGPLFFNALAKRDWAELEIDPGAGLGAEFDADLFGVQLNTGLRLELGAVFAEPSVGLSWVQADLDSFASGPATIEPGSVDSLRARAGLRVGARLPMGGGTLLPFAAVDVYDELGDDNETDFTLGETLRLFDEPAGTRGQAAAGLSFVAAGFEAFVRGEMDFSGDVDAKAIRAGARVRF